LEAPLPCFFDYFIFLIDRTFFGECFFVVEIKYVSLDADFNLKYEKTFKKQFDGDGVKLYHERIALNN